MKVIIAGTRTFEGYHVTLLIRAGLYMIDNPGGENPTIISGGANGVDRIAASIAKANDWNHIEMPADWDQHGLAAGPIRNKQMAEAGDHLLLVWNGESRGSASMRKEAMAAGIPITEIIVRQP